jgi:hypothetical protein
MADYFGARYFASSYFAPRYFGVDGGGGGAIVADIVAALMGGSALTAVGTLRRLKLPKTNFEPGLLFARARGVIYGP